MAPDEVDGNTAPRAGRRRRGLEVGEQRAIEIDGVAELSRPVERAHVEQARRSRARRLAGDHARQVVHEQLREHQEVSGARQLLAVVSGELEDRVEGEGLETIDLVQPASADSLDHVFVRVGAIVAIGQRRLEEFAATIEKAVVHAPRVNADRGDRAGLHRERESALHLGNESGPVPSQVFVTSASWCVRDAVENLQARRAVADLGAAHPDRRRAEVDGRDGGGHVTARWRRSPRRARRPSPGGNRRAGTS